MGTGTTEPTMINAIDLIRFVVNARTRVLFVCHNACCHRNVDVVNHNT